VGAGVGRFYLLLFQLDMVKDPMSAAAASSSSASGGGDDWVGGSDGGLAVENKALF
jgi:hypothetical protein